MTDEASLRREEDALKIRAGIAAVLLLAVFTAPAFAQEGVSGGVKVGVGFANLSSDDEDFDSLDTRTGVVVGGFANVPVGERLSVVIEALFTQKGAKEVFEDDSEVTIKLDYIEVPILFNVGFDTMTTVQPFVYAGVAPAFNTSAKVVEEFGDGEEDEVDIDDDVKAFDVGLVFGGGVRFGIFAVEGRYTLGLVNVNDDADVDESVKNRQAAILFSVMFGPR